MVVVVVGICKVVNMIGIFKMVVVLGVEGGDGGGWRFLGGVEGGCKVVVGLDWGVVGWLWDSIYGMVIVAFEWEL